MILVTGGAGFIGSHLVERLIEANEKVRILVKKDSKDLANLDKVRSKVEIVEGNLLEGGSLDSVLKGIDKVFHLAAIARPMDIPKQVYYNTNVEGSKNLMKSCEKNKVKKIIHVSTMSIFGFSRDHTPLTENSPRLPVSDYGESKKQGEEFIFNFCKENKLNLVIVRPPMVFGPRDLQFLGLFKTINKGFFPFFKRGNSKFEFTYVKNFIEGILLADKYGKNLEAYDINDGKTHNIKDVFYKIAKAENRKLVPIYMPVWLGVFLGVLSEAFYGVMGKKPPFNSGTAKWMSTDNSMDISKAKKEIHYEGKISLEQSIRETVEWYKEKGYLQ